MTRKAFLYNAKLCLLQTFPFLHEWSIGLEQIDVTTHDIALRRAVAGSGKPVTIAQISDLHFGKFRRIHEEVIAAVNRIAPDIIVITGDTINGTPHLPLIYDFVSRLSAGSGIFAVLGNWEHWSLAGTEAIRREYERSGCRLLVNERADVTANGTGLTIVGVDDLYTGSPDTACCISPKPADGSFRLLLSHCPSLRDRAPVGDNFDLMLSGHTHGGQVNMLGFSPYLPPGSGRYVAGWYRDRVPHLYVNRGVGTTFIPVRIGARPELAIFRIS